AIVRAVRWQSGRGGISCGVVATVCAGAVTSLTARLPAPALSERAALAPRRPTLADAQNLFYNARYEAAAALTLALRSSETEGLTGVELRTSALLFQLKALLEGGPDKPDGDKDQALRDCTTCPDLIADFLQDIHRGQDMARI